MNNLRSFRVRGFFGKNLRSFGSHWMVDGDGEDEEEEEETGDDGRERARTGENG